MYNIYRTDYIHEETRGIVETIYTQLSKDAVISMYPWTEILLDSLDKFYELSFTIGSRKIIIKSCDSTNM